ncbi:MAG: histidine--tRNA ligase [Candidatus Aenigmatarchaeota archaeon]
MKFHPPKGMRDFGTEEMVIREYVIQTIKKIFEAYGFETIETPALEDLELLTAKSGEDVAKQIFKVESEKERKLGLRFDLTVPLARFLANNPQLPKPFKRYVIAPVWRYEEPQAGRLRQFYQADVDICGSSSMEADVECIACAIDCLKALGFRDLRVRINNRKVLEAFVEILKEKIPEEAKIEFGNLEVFRAIDKLGKIGTSGVKEELKKIGMPKKQIEELLEIISIEGKYEDVLKKGEAIVNRSSKGREGIEELKKIYEFSKFYGISDLIVLDFSLARGLDYYTGPIFEIEVKGGKIGSLAGGGRYDKLVELYGGKPTQATGISLGIERIIEILKKEKSIQLPQTKVKVFVANVEENLKKQAVEIAESLRKAGISTQVDLMNRSLTKQLEYADSLGIPFIVIVGKKEVEKSKFKLKNMKKKTEKELALKEIIMEVDNSIRKLE